MAVEVDCANLKTLKARCGLMPDGASQSTMGLYNSSTGTNGDSNRFLVQSTTEFRANLSPSGHKRVSPFRVI